MNLPLKLVQKTSNINNKVCYGLYNIMRNPGNVKETPVPLYESKDLNKVDVQESKQGLQKFLALTPFYLEKLLGFQSKQFVVKMDLLPESKQLVLECLNHDQTITKTVQLENIVPVTYEDFVHASRRKILEQAPFIDNEMIYFNSMQQEFYIFDEQGQWNQEGVSHPALSLENNFDEKKWFDKIRIL